MSQSIHRAAHVLEHVSVRPRTQSEIAELLGVHRSTALRILQALTESGLTRRNADGSYSIGYRLAGLAAVAAEQFDLRAVARPVLTQLGQACGHTIHLAALEGSEVVYADKIEQPGTVRMYSQVGQRVRLHTSGVGKAILAYQDQEQVERMLADYEFDTFTETTLASREQLDAELVAIRERGWAQDDGEFEDYVNCVAMPIRDALGNVNGAVSITAIKAQADLTALQELLPRLEDVTRSISRSVGWRP
ncbi:IclR family transcriptional regulator [Nesterenkonia flava]|uniref:IclR family transcriptional regulator n=1 Tax=Nesterenkonia flava TaxID=469799 RepID=A0ABU1FWN0_9MICC|nr:IclR family transcriptional regulator [Nesterenkonia flava]MDR5712657.1 IclR family transcriptional regulator [Nesterenkonia flava]